MAFKVISKGVGRGQRPRITILSRGQIGFTLGAIKACKIEPESYMVILFDEEGHKLGFKFNVDPNTEGAVNLKTFSSGALYSAKGLLQLCQIDYTVTKTYDLIFDETNKLHVIDLTKGVPKVKANKEDK